MGRAMLKNDALDAIETLKNRFLGTSCMASKYIVPLTQRRLPATVGAKARNLRNLSDKGYLIPNTSVLTWDAYTEYLHDNVSLVNQFTGELKQVVSPGTSYAVRSSANIEDGLDFSFAGQFKTMLNMHGIEQIMQAIWAIWSSAQSNSLTSYIEKFPGIFQDLKMAILIQEMVKPEVSGVSFSKNPITSLDEIVVEAIPGSGERLVQDGITPFRWVEKWGTWLDVPEASEISKELIEEVVGQTRRISKLFHKDVDLEWVYDGNELFWVQMRDITSARVKNIYSNRISKEMLPGQIKPLVWSVAVPTHSASWLEIIHDLIGDNNIDLSDMIRAFHYRAYFNMSVFGRIFESIGMPPEVIGDDDGTCPTRRGPTAL